MTTPSGSDEDESITPSERRLGGRQLACFPAYLERDDGTTRVAMIRDLSASGARLVVRANVKVGDPVVLKLFIHGDTEKSRDARARVVRTETIEDPGLWSLRIAVQFDDELTDVLPEIASLADHQAGR